MINLLAIETSNAICSVGLYLDGNRFIRSEHVDKRHNERLLPMLSSLREEAGLSQSELLEKLAGVAFGCGPGSFTGVRIAAAAAQALALAAGTPILRVSSSRMLALKAFQQATDSQAAAIDGQLAGVITAIRSRRNLHYLAAYEMGGGLPQAVLAEALYEESPDAPFYERYSGWALAGSVPEWWQGSAAVSVFPDADQVLVLAQAMAESGAQVDVAAGLPEYVTGDSPWRKSGG